VPEGPEVETDRLQEEIREELEHGRGGGMIMRIALSTALFAALAAISALRAGATVNQALILKTEAARLQAEASDQWAYYQAKGIKAAAAEAARASWLAIAKEPPPEYADKEKRYGEEQKEIEKKARELEKRRDEKSGEADELLHHHHGFANTVALFQVAIALGAVAALTRSRPVWFASLLLGGAAAVLFALTLLR
jgi:DNA repair exonuclease SbcCD ATPase subunit